MTGFEREDDRELYYRKMLLQIFSQSKAEPLEQVYAPFEFGKARLFDVGSYSMVVKFCSNVLGTDCIMKMLKMRQLSCLSIEETTGLDFATILSVGTKDVNSNKEENRIGVDEQYVNVFQEVVMCHALSNLNQTIHTKEGLEYRTPGYPVVYRTALTCGLLQKELKFCEPSVECVTICMNNCGISLKKAIFKWSLNARQLLCIGRQLLLALIVAEGVYEYEHRDLHMSNVLVRQCCDDAVLHYVVGCKPYRVHSHGVRASIIDNTFSRMRIDNQIYYTPLSNKLDGIVGRFVDSSQRGTVTRQENVYKRMYMGARHEWSSWLPKSNIWWLKYIFSRLTDHIKQQGMEKDTEEGKQLRNMLEVLETCKSPHHLVDLLDKINLS